MNKEQFDILVNAAIKRQLVLLQQKGEDYTRKNTDRLFNFKHTAAEIGLSPFQVWAIYASKHWDALMTFIKTGKTESEPIASRLDDLHNYLYLLEGLISDEHSSVGQ